MHFVCVANPVSGKGRAIRIYHSLSTRLKERGHEVELLKTHANPEVFRQRCKAIKPNARVIVIGGDGTLAHFLFCCSNFHGVTLFGQGTANVVSIEFAIPRKQEAFVDMLEADRRLTIRPIETEDQDLIVMMYSAGIDAAILHKTSQSLKNKIGKVAFLVSTLKVLFSYRYNRFRVRGDQGPAQSVCFAVATRFRHYGGPYLLAPEVDYGDDRIHLIALRKGGLVATLSFFWHLFRGQVAKHKHVWTCKAKTITFDYPEAGIPGQKDGDFCRPHTVLKSSSRCISVIVP